MKLAEVIPLFKKGLKDQMENYRPISLLITISKSLEKCIYKRLYNFLDKNNIFYEKQYGFRKNQSCEREIQNLYGHLLKNKEEGIKSVAIFLDLLKAFNTLSHNLLLKKLELYRVCGLCNKWFESYISNRKLQVKCHTLSSNQYETSNKYSVRHGTAQGSCLGPLLFNVFCNDIYTSITHCDLILFADDTTMYASHRNSNYLSYIIQEDLNNLTTWFKLNSLTLNIQKSSAMEFLPEHNQPTNTYLTIKIEDSNLCITNTTKFLGVTIDNDLSWHDHIENVIKKISSNKLIIGKSRKILSIAAKHNIYYAHIHSHLLYANVIWSGHMKSKQRSNIEKVQKYCVRAIMNKPKNYHTDPLFKELKIMKIKEREHFESSKLAFCIKEKLLPQPIIKMFHTYGRKNHPYNTRNKDLPNIKKHKSDSYNRSFLCKSLHNFGTLKKKLQLSKSKNEFVSSYKKHLFNTEL